MEVTAAVRAMIAGAGLRIVDVSRALGKTDNVLTASLARAAKGGGMSTSTLAPAAEVCGYRLALVPADNLPPDALTIDPPR